MMAEACLADPKKMNLSNITKVKIKLLHPDAKIPIRFNEKDACYDVYATSRKDYGDGRIGYGLGFSLELPPNTQLDCRARSSIHKTGMVLANSIGTIDEDYRGELMAVFYHIIPTLPPYEIGDRILQIQLRSREDVEFITHGELSETKRGDGGFGSSGLK